MRMHLLPNTDLKVSTICYGGGAWGTVVTGQRMDRLIHAFRDAGGNFFDTAHAYSFWLPGGNGASEVALADYFRRHGGRNEIVIATKGGHPSGNGYRKVDQYLSAGRLAADIDDSLGRLGVDTLDLYWLHRDDPRLQPGEIIESLNAEVKRGRLRHLGASNWTAARMAAANAYAAAHGLRGFVASQPQWYLAQPPAKPADATMRFLDDADRRWHEQTQIPVVPYSPTANGYFATGGKSRKPHFDTPANKARLQRVHQLAKEFGCTPNQIALAFLMNHGFPVIPILGTNKIAHLRDALGAGDVKLTPQQVTWLRDG